MSTPDGPARDHSLNAIARCVAVRRALHRDDPQRGDLTDSAIAERVHGVPVPTRPGPDAWWLVGQVLDEIANQAFNVWLVPGELRLGMSPRGRHVPALPTPVLPPAQPSPLPHA